MHLCQDSETYLRLCTTVRQCSFHKSYYASYAVYAGHVGHSGYAGHVGYAGHALHLGHLYLDQELNFRL